MTQTMCEAECGRESTTGQIFGIAADVCSPCSRAYLIELFRNQPGVMADVADGDLRPSAKVGPMGGPALDHEVYKRALASKAVLAESVSLWLRARADQNRMLKQATADA